MENLKKNVTFDPGPILEIIQSKTGKLDQKIVFKNILYNSGSNLMDKSCCQFNRDAKTLNILGFINGILSETVGKVLVVYIKYNCDNVEFTGNITQKCKEMFERGEFDIIKFEIVNK
jgi:hypothetical protein